MTDLQSLIEKLCSLSPDADAGVITVQAAIDTVRAHIEQPATEDEIERVARAIFKELQRRLGVARGYINDMAIAHEMSHERFCDTSAWKDDFDRCLKQALATLEGK